MSFEDYDQYIAQKHRLAVALSVIITKPDDETLVEYTNRTKNEIIAKEMATNVDVSVNDNDFNMSDDYIENDGTNDDQIDLSQDSVTILKNFDENKLGNEADANSLLEVMTQLSHIDENSVNQMSTNTQNNITQSTFCEESQHQETNSINILNDPDDILTFYESCSEGSTNQPTNNRTTFCENNTANDINVANNVNKEIDIQNSNIDSQQTEIYTLQGFTNNSHISQSQEDLVITRKHLLKKHVCSTKNAYNEENSLKSIYPSFNYSFVEKNKKCNEIMPIEQDFGVKFNTNTLSGKNEKIIIATDGKIKCGKSYENDKQTSCVSSDSMTQMIINATSETSKIGLRKAADEYLAVFSNQLDDTYDNNKNISVHEQYSVNNDLNYIIPYKSQDAQSYNILSDNKGTAQTKKIRFPREESLNPSLTYQNEYIKHIMPTEYNSNGPESIKELTIKQNNFIHGSINFDEPINDLDQTIKDNEHKIIFNSDSNVNAIQCKLKLNLNNSINLDLLNDEKDFHRAQLETERNILLSSNTEMETEHIYIDLTKDETTESIPYQSGVSKNISTDNRMLDKDIFSDNATESQVEIVSFKTLEELNKIKCYLNKRERYLSEGNSSDSGFRSSQPRSSYNNASQYSEGWINESAHCLLTYIKTCQPSGRTMDFTDEISKILGKLVDKLHEQEKYPKFLEELLETVDLLLTDVYEGNNEEINKLIRKDEAIYRLLLLNKSMHIIKYTIEKIVNILEDILSDLSDIEITNTDRCENICYIFHILEIILQRNKSISSQDLQSSHDESVLKKSSLTEIWRKKWNFSKIEVNEGSSKKKCVLTKCSEVLNKVIVQAIDGYSLIAFAALQCFNLLQN